VADAVVVPDAAAADAYRAAYERHVALGKALFANAGAATAE
jgi:hypothetical protein